MTIQTKFHGAISIEGITKWTFPKGIPGLENENQFVLLPIEGNNSFQVMQSVVSPSVAFIVANPYTIVSDYTFAIDDPTLELLGIESQEDLMILSIMTMKNPFHLSTVNLQAPLIFNIQNQTARQMIINDTNYSIRHPIGESAEKEAR